MALKALSQQINQLMGLIRTNAGMQFLYRHNRLQFDTSI